MSLEQALAANTAALQALTAALASSGTALPHPAPSAQPAQPAPSTAGAVPQPTAPVASTDTCPAPTTAFAQPAQTLPQPAAPAAPPTASPAASGERDAKGMPWDGRIHSSSKALVADGTWRYKRGTGETYIKQIENEIRATLAAPAAPAPAGSAFGPYPFPQDEQHASVVASVAPAAPVVAAPVAAAPVVAPPPAAPVAGAVPPAAGINTYEALMAALPSKITSGELTATQMQQACEAYGVPSIAALATRPDLVPFVAATLKL